MVGEARAAAKFPPMHRTVRPKMSEVLRNSALDGEIKRL
jgi:hypothetical protein